MAIQAGPLKGGLLVGRPQQVGEGRPHAHPHLPSTFPFPRARNPTPGTSPSTSSPRSSCTASDCWTPGSRPSSGAA